MIDGLVEVDKIGAEYAQLAEIIKLRDYMAMSALGTLNPDNVVTCKDMAIIAYKIAEAMLEERKKYENIP